MKRLLLINASPKREGATQEIARIVRSALPEGVQAELICLGDVEFAMCIGCKRCYETGDCFRRDGVQALLEKLNVCDAVVIVCPSWWGDVPAQFKALIDRCTPYADTAPENGHFTLRKGIRCYGIALRAGTRSGECEHILQCIAHFCGHMGLDYAGGAYFTGIDAKNDVERYKNEIGNTAQTWVCVYE